MALPVRGINSEPEFNHVDVFRRFNGAEQSERFCSGSFSI